MPARRNRRRVLIAGAAAAAGAGMVAALLQSAVVIILGCNAAAIAAAVGAWLSEDRGDDSAELIAAVSHELRTPLTGILGTFELLTEAGIPLEPSEVDELLLAAHGEANHMLHIIGNLHARSRLQRSTLEPARVPVDVRAIVTRAVSRSPRIAGRTQLSPGDSAAVVGDAQLIMQIVTNLIQNVARYAPDGELHIRFERRDGWMLTSFSDDGPGVAPEDAERIFRGNASTRGLGIGLGLSRALAAAMGGGLTLEPSQRRGATFVLRLPASDQPAPPQKVHTVLGAGKTPAHSPRARLLIDLAEALSEPSLDRVIAGIRKLYVELLGATGGVLLIPGGDGSYSCVGAMDPAAPRLRAAALNTAMTGSGSLRVDALGPAGMQALESIVGGRAALLLPVRDAERTVAVLAIGWKAAEAIPEAAARNVAEALANVAASAIDRTELARDVVFERALRSSVLDELPLAVSIFVGDPPRVIDWNRKEREMLGLADDSRRPEDLDQSQTLFDVRFADGTPLTVENAPVSTAIRTGKAAGPFILVVRRLDGTQVHTRTYCAPFFGHDGRPAGAVVTSEPLDLAAATGALLP
jgi:K+-sensing histidine kinase KdpD